MCRFVTYLGQPVPLQRVLSDFDHSLVVQSYRPVEMTSGVVNADGFGVGWYNRALDDAPCVYTNTCPIWSDQNLPSLSRHIAADCIFANVRSATPGFGVDHANCQPFAYRQFMFMHNGYIQNFRSTLMRRLRQALRDEYYTFIEGSTDSEHNKNSLSGSNTPTPHRRAEQKPSAYTLPGPPGSCNGRPAFPLSSPPALRIIELT